MEALGKHVLVEYTGCSKQALDDVSLIEESMVRAAREAGATVINSTSHHFSPWGVSCVVVIQESHLSIHTWPEYQFASVDLYTCGDTVDPWVAFKSLSKALVSNSFSVTELKRGLKVFLPKPDITFKTELPQDESSQETSSEPKKVGKCTWFQELSYSIGAGVCVKTNERIFKQRSEFQNVEVYSTEKWGNMLVLDGVVNATEKDEFVYHEMIAHVPILSHPNPKKILVIGGGDGGTVREILKHSSVEKVVMVEIDALVIEASKKHLPGLSCAFNDPKLELLIDDGIKYVMDAADKSFDVIIVDSTDPSGPGEVLFTDEFYSHCIRILTDDGILTCQSQSFSGAPQKFKEVYARFDKIFGKDKVWPYIFNIPTYPTGLWTFSFCSKGQVHPLNSVDVKKLAEFSKEKSLSYYNEDIHKSCFSLPNYARQMIER